jgi:cytochrome c553
VISLKALFYLQINYPQETFGDRMKKILFFGLILASSLALSQDKGKGQQLYGKCIECHKHDGSGSREKNAPRIGGLQDWYILTSLKNFQTGKRTNPEMMPIIENMSEQDFKDLASFVSEL